MITTNHNHHEQTVALLPIVGPAVGCAVTILVCYIKHKTETHDTNTKPENKDHDKES